MASNVSLGEIRINLKAGTAQFSESLDNARRKISEFGHASVTNTQAASAAIRTLEGGITNNIRAAERWIASIRGVGPLLQAAFPAVGAIAFAGVITELVGKINEAREALQKMQQAAQRMADGFRAINDTLEKSNDELALTNVKLENAIAKLEGKPQNGLKEALEAARVSADNLSESLRKALADTEKLLNENKTPLWQQLLGKADTSELEDGFQTFQKQINDITAFGNTRLHAPTGPGLFGIHEKLDPNAVVADTNRQIQAATQKYIQSLTQQLLTAQQGIPALIDLTGTGAGSFRADTDKYLAEVKGLIEQAQRIADSSQLHLDNDRLTGRKDALEANKGSEKTDYYAELLTRLKAELAGAKTEAANAGNTFSEALARGSAKAATEIASLNSELAKNKQAASLSQIANITALNTQIALNELLKRQKEREAEAQKQAAEATVKSLDQIQAAMDRAAKAGEEKERQDSARLQKLRGELAAIRHEADALYGNREDRFQAQLAGIRAKGREENTPQEQIDEQVQLATAQHNLDLKKLGVGQSASDGFREFFHQMSDNAKSAGQQVKEALGGTFDGLNDQLSRLVSGQKTSWASFFQGLSADIGKAALQAAEAKIFSKLFGNLFGGTGSSGGGTGGGLFSGLSGMVSHAFGGSRAGGGDVYPGSAYVVGEKRPELFIPDRPGTILPSTSLGSTTHVYNIDARGTDPVLTAQRTRAAILAAHESAINKSFRATQEHTKRTPQTR